MTLVMMGVANEVGRGLMRKKRINCGGEEEED